MKHLFRFNPELLFSPQTQSSQDAQQALVQEHIFRDTMKKYFTVAIDDREIYPRFRPLAFQHAFDCFTTRELELLEAGSRNKVKKPIFEGMADGFESQTQSEDWHFPDYQTTTPKKRSNNILQTLSFVCSHPRKFQVPNTETLIHLHSLLFEGTPISGRLRIHPQSFSYSNYLPPMDIFAVCKALDDALVESQKYASPFSKALGIAIMIAYTQPFEDGNKRIAALMCNATLMAHGKKPLPQKNLDGKDLLKSLIVFYERNDPSLAKYLFMKHYLDSGSRL